MVAVVPELGFMRPPHGRGTVAALARLSRGVSLIILRFSTRVDPERGLELQATGFAFDDGRHNSVELGCIF